MKPIYLILGCAVLASAGAAAARERVSPDARLAAITAGRVAGAPVDCINQRDIRSTEIIDDVGIVYRGNNGTIYVNRPSGGASFLDGDDILLTKTYSDRLCRIDIVTLIDRSTRMTSGSIGLGDFIPYPKPARSAAAR